MCYRNTLKDMKTLVRIQTQMQENKSDTDVPSWRNKGGHEFIVEAPSDTLMYAHDLDAVLDKMIQEQGNDHERFTYQSHELVFHKPSTLDEAELVKRIQTQWQKANGE